MQKAFYTKGETLRSLLDRRYFLFVVRRYFLLVARQEILKNLFFE